MAPEEFNAQSFEVQSKMPDFFERYQKTFWYILIVAAFIIGALVIYVLFFRDSGNGNDYQGDVAINIEAPAETANGSEILYSITIENLSSIKLTDLALELFYPAGFEFLDSTPDIDAPGRTLALSDLERGGTHEIAIVGRIEGRLQEVKSVSAKLRYVPENFRSSFLAENSASTVIIAPDVIMRLAAPPQIVTGQVISYEIELSNITARDFSNIEVVLEYPERFIFKDAQLPSGVSFASNSDNKRLIIDNLPSAGRTLAIVSGTVSGDQDGSSEVFASAQLFFKDNDGNEFLGGRSFAFTTIRPSPLRLDYSISTGNRSLVAGEQVRYDIEYRNTGDTGLSNVAITMKFENPEVFDISDISLQTGQFRNNSVVWTPALDGRLSVIDPGESGNMQVNLSIKEQELLTQKNPLAAVSFEFSSRELPEALGAGRLERKIKSDIELRAQTSLVSGPNPPTAGQTTIYNVELFVGNSVNDMREVTLTGVLPRADAQIIDGTINPAVERANFIFTPVAGTIRWDLNELFAFTGSFHEERNLSFQVSITPFSGGQSFQTLILRDLVVSGVDSFTLDQIESNKIQSLSAN